MKPLSFKNRIAFNYIITTALLIFVVFFAIFSIVKYSVYVRVNNEIKEEVAKHLKEIEVVENCVLLIREEQWKLKEFNRLDASPAFIQFVDELGTLVEKSPNLKQKQLHFYPKVKENKLFDAKLDNISVRQTQIPLYQGTKIIGYLVVAMSLEDSVMVLNNLFIIMLIAFPVILIILFLIARFIAGKSIKPINSIINTANFITKDNLESRIPLPQNKDELYILSQTINNLLERIENAVIREKQFTSDASHELRTPLAVIKGTLEVLVRKPRTEEEYKEKIGYCVSEVNRLNHLVDELLLLARFENQKQNQKLEQVNIVSVVSDTLARNSAHIKDKKLNIITDYSNEVNAKTDSYLFALIVNNILTNAIKYSNNSTDITISIEEKNDLVICSIADNGIGIAKEEINKIFDQFYRSKSNEHPEIKGTGLGLSIVRRLCDLLEINLNINSEENKGTTVYLTLKK
ncbi:MAG TPA: HAMP domain-containing sensor histidine kinase [Flavobacterium sp.]|jgi:signal transduction histidine kinase|uniref:sensor histidine kinase n=1 Tax=Flavobacterium sp. TaxID=239 RepID=UPI002CA3DF77|nr:HAMP domain-containing sensor histidine kinase [Flavobacterium sp.]MCA0347747.1 HAMP domain-containing histidine kinase [Bacteroidota bacterium]HPW98270.1 HAMP domain-containing sensor histidine kinase [Flavobacterium sp.]HQA74533.1 HAMP domain-containing sensor histidine kinase [Flavobacterium sp.]